MIERFYGRRIHFEKIGVFEPEHRAVLMNEIHRRRVRSRSKTGAFEVGMLGHASLETTALYTHVAIRTLKEVHERTHPGANLGRAKPSRTVPAKAAADDLLSILAVEADDERE